MTKKKRTHEGKKKRQKKDKTKKPKHQIAPPPWSLSYAKKKPMKAIMKNEGKKKRKKKKPGKKEKGNKNYNRDISWSKNILQKQPASPPQHATLQIHDIRRQTGKSEVRRAQKGRGKVCRKKYKASLMSPLQTAAQ
jgi:hypothetical protein